MAKFGYVSIVYIKIWTVNTHILVVYQLQIFIFIFVLQILKKNVSRVRVRSPNPLLMICPGLFLNLYEFKKIFIYLVVIKLSSTMKDTLKTLASLSS